MARRWTPSWWPCKKKPVDTVVENRDLARLMQEMEQLRRDPSRPGKMVQELGGKAVRYPNIRPGTKSVEEMPTFEEQELVGRQKYPIPGFSARTPPDYAPPVHDEYVIVAELERGGRTVFTVCRNLAEMQRVYNDYCRGYAMDVRWWYMTDPTK